MFSRVFVILSLNGGEEVGIINGQPPPPWDQVRTSTPPPVPGQNIYPPPPPPGPGQNIYPPGDYTQAGGTNPTGMHSC